MDLFILFTVIIFGFVVYAIIAAIQEDKSRLEREKEEQARREEEQRKQNEYQELKREVEREIGSISVRQIDEYLTVKSRATLEKYDHIKFLKENRDRFSEIENSVQRKNNAKERLQNFLLNNKYKEHSRYNTLKNTIEYSIENASAYRIEIMYITQAGNNLGEKTIAITLSDIEKIKKDPSLIMGKGEYNKHLKEQQREALEQKHHEYYDLVNEIVDYANNNKDRLIIKGSKEELDGLILKLFDRTVNSIKKVKTLDSEEWHVIESFIVQIDDDVRNLVERNNRILNYYKSEDFAKIKNTCEALMGSQREFNEYISEKVESISSLFGTRVIRSETVNNDEYNYIRHYKKTITPFSAEVSAQVFASAENNPLEYVVKYFYPNKTMHPEQIQKLHTLIEELETLREAKEIIENYKKEYQQYLGDVPKYILEEDEAGFYSKLGFAHIDESELVIEYKFAYTSGGGMAHRSFTVPMTEETIIELIHLLESKLTASAFSKEQRNLMTKKLREFIKKRDDFTCCNCGNSTYKEPNLLLEIDHITPVSKGGITEESNLQTLCWKCNRAKSNKIM